MGKGCCGLVEKEGGRKERRKGGGKKEREERMKLERQEVRRETELRTAGEEGERQHLSAKEIRPRLTATWVRLQPHGARRQMVAAGHGSPEGEMKPALLRPRGQMVTEWGREQLVLSSYTASAGHIVQCFLC